MNNQTGSNTDRAHKRIFGLDVFRGWAIAMMIVFHFSYYLSYFRLADIDVVNGTFWVYFRYLIVSIFMIGVGVSLDIVHTPRIRWNKVGKRALILGLSASAVTVATYFQAPHAWIYFGILHLIFVASLLGLAFVHHPRAAFIAAIVIFILSYLDITGQHALYHWVRPILHLPYQTEDLARFFPWFGAVLMGIAGYDLGWGKYLFDVPLLASRNRWNKILSFMGRHSLLIYLIHAPLLYGAVMFVSKIVR